MAVKKTKGGELTVTIDSVDYKAELTSLQIVNEEADNDTATFAEVGAGGAVTYYMDITAIGDYQDASLWSVIWDNPGDTYTYSVAPYGGAGATNAPVLTGSLKVGSAPTFGGEAGTNWTFDYRFELTAKPTKDNVA